MKKECKKGFTLVELLAVIVILAVIAIITTPMILGVIDKAKKGAFQSSVKGIEDSIELQQLENEGKITNYTVVNGVITNIETNEIISTKGGNDINGNIKVKKDGRIIYALNNNKECIIKRDGQEEIEQIRGIKFCTMEVATNLVKNGYGEYEDNTNFSNFTYENGAFIRSTITPPKEITSDEFIRIDSSKKYVYSMDIKNNGTNTPYYAGLWQYDYNKMRINAASLSYVQNTLTTLAQDLKDGDTVVYFKDLSSPAWQPTSSDSTSKLGLIFWNYQNNSGYVYPAEIYSQNYYHNLYAYDKVNQSTNVIALKTPWNKGTIAAGTRVSRSSSNGTYSYGLLNNQVLTTQYQTVSKTMNGVKDYALHNHYFSSATEYVKWLTIDNYNSILNTTTYYRNIIIREIEE